MCPKCSREGSITATVGVEVHHSCVHCGQGWRSVKAMKRKKSRRRIRGNISLDFAAILGEITVRMADCFKGREVRLEAVKVR